MVPSTNLPNPHAAPDDPKGSADRGRGGLEIGSGRKTSPPAAGLRSEFAIHSESPEESEGEATLRKRTSVKDINLAGLSKPNELRTWMGALYTKTRAASNRRGTRTIRYIMSIETCTEDEPWPSLQVVSRKWESL